MAQLIKFIVVFTSRNDWGSPSIAEVMGIDRNDALEKAAESIGFSMAEVDEMNGVGEHDYLIIESEFQHS